MSSWLVITVGGHAIGKFFHSGITVVVFADLFSPKSCGPPLKLSKDLKISLQWFQVFFLM